MGQAGAVVGVIQAGASLFGGSGGSGGTQYVPNNSAMNQVQLASIDLLSRNYDMQKQLSDAAFQNNLGMQDAEYKRLLTQLAYDQEAQHNTLLSQAYQSQAATNAAETTLEMERLKQVYDRGAKETAAKMEFDNTITQIDNQKIIRDLSNASSQEEFQRKLAETQAQMGDTRQMRTLQTQNERLQRQELATQYQALSTEERGLLLNELKTAEDLTGQLAQLGNQGVQLDEQAAGLSTQASQQRQQLMGQFIEQARKQELGNSNKLAQMSSSGLVNAEGTMARQSMGQMINPVDQLKRTLGLDQINTGEALGMAGVQSGRDYLGSLQQAALRGDALAQQQLALMQEQLANKGQGLNTTGQQMGLSEQQTGLEYGSQQRGLQNQFGSIMNAMYTDAIQNGMAPDLAAQLARQQAQQSMNLNTGSMGVDSMLQDYGYDMSKAGLSYGRSQDAQSLLDYQNMINSQGDLNLQSAQSSYLTGLMSQYAQDASNQSQLASGASAGINNTASNISGTTMVNQQPTQGFNFKGLTNLAQAGVGLFSSLGGGSTATTQSTPQLTDMSIPYMGYK